MTAVQAPHTRLPDRLDECLAALGRALERPADGAALREAIGAVQAALASADARQQGGLRAAEIHHLRALTSRLRVRAALGRQAATRALVALGLGDDPASRRSTHLHERG